MLLTLYIKSRVCCLEVEYNAKVRYLFVCHRLCLFGGYVSREPSFVANQFPNAFCLAGGGVAHLCAHQLLSSKGMKV